MPVHRIGRARLWVALFALVGILALTMLNKTISAAPPPLGWTAGQSSEDGTDGTWGLENEKKERELIGRQQLKECTDSSGRVRPDLWLKGVEAFKQLPVASSSNVAGNGDQPEAINGLQWTQIGPAPLQIDAGTVKYQGVGPDSGEVVDIAIDPQGGTDSTIYIATGDGGIWKTIDGGNTGHFLAFLAPP